MKNPKLADGKTPRGFLGYAVNIVDLDINHLYTTTSAGHGLRETLLYELFGELHVYQTREDMIAARACCSSHGAVSLDGGILQKNGVISLGYGYAYLSLRSLCKAFGGIISSLSSLFGLPDTNPPEFLFIMQQG